MTLHDQLTRALDEVDETGPDLVRLTALARRRGAGLRRRRAAGLSVAAAVTAAALTGGAWAALPGSGPNPAPVATDALATHVVAPDLDGPTAATTGPAAALALEWAVDQQRAGAASALSGQLSGTSGDYYVQLAWDDADGMGGSLVGLNVQHGRGMFAGCRQVRQGEEARGCESILLADGSHLITYTERATTLDGVGLRRVADLLRPDHLRVVATATNGFEHAGGEWDLTRSTPPLATADLTSLVRQPWWGDTLPVAFVDAGTGLAGYTDLDAHSGWSRGPA